MTLPSSSKPVEPHDELDAQFDECRCPACTAARVDRDGVDLECLEGPGGCRGDVEMRWPGYGEKAWPRCEKHGNARLEREEENIRRNMPDGPSAPRGFDPYDVGERWEGAA